QRATAAPLATMLVLLLLHRYRKRQGGIYRLRKGCAFKLCWHSFLTFNRAGISMFGLDVQAGSVANDPAF
ncbi:MAG TPA: hypothetical protein VL125_06045, partial [Pelobium sp.]|nr:hypothetical protein [Pelobium sp.]